MKPHSLLLFLASTVAAHIQSETNSDYGPDRAITGTLDGERLEITEDENYLQSDNFNTSIPANLRPPFFLHSDELSSYSEGLLRWPRDVFQKRDYKCPTDTTNCSSIGRPNSCCGQGQQCILVQNTGSGDVGCCPSGLTCANAIGTCNTAAGYSACPSASNGGCCIPGYTCDSIGCIATGTTTTSISGSTVYVVSNSLTSVVVSTLTTTAVISLVSASAATTTIISTTTVTPLIQPTTYYSTITTPTSTIYGVTTVTASPAILATTNQQSSTLSGTCAVGYYQCSAFDQLCCQVGVGCESSSCLTSASSTTVVSGSGATVVLVLGSTATGLTTFGVPRSSGQVLTTTILPSTPSTSIAATTTSVFGLGTCATGWFSCAANIGGGCCPTGYSCAASCVATQTGIPNHVYKVAPSGTSSANRTSRSDGLVMYALAMTMLLFTALS